MNKQKKQTLILLIALVIVVGLFLLFKYVIDLEPEEEEDEGTVLWDIDKDSVTYLYFTGSEEDIELTLDGETWVLTGHEEEDIDSSVISSAMGYIDDVTALEELGTLDNLSDFGLEEPSNVIKFTADGTDYVLTIGDYNSNASGYYIQINEDPTVYVWDKTKYLPFDSKTWEDFVAEEEEEETEETADVSAEE